MLSGIPENVYSRENSQTASSKIANKANLKTAIKFFFKWTRTRLSS